MMARVILFVSVLMVFLSPVALADHGEPAAENKLPPVLHGVSVTQRLNEQVPADVAFKDETGRQVKLGDYFGSKPIILTMNYYECPQLCSRVLEGLVASLNKVKLTMGKDYEVVTVSIDPRETPELAEKAKKSYMERYGGEGSADGWHFLTGDEAAIGRLAKAIGYQYRYVPTNDTYAHPSALTLLTGSGKISRYFFGISYLERDLRLGLVEASGNKIGTPIDQAMLFCLEYDPATGKYGPLAVNIVRGGAVLTALILGSFLFLLWRRDLRQHRGVTGGVG